TDEGRQFTAKQCQKLWKKWQSSYRFAKIRLTMQNRTGGGTPFWELPPPQRRQLASLNDTLKNLSQEQYTMLEAVMGSDPATEPPVSVSGGVKTVVYNQRTPQQQMYQANLQRLLT
ncbi:hypothetical protein HaLaN_31351, partial [Haematococcus lacustris]